MTLVPSLIGTTLAIEGPIKAYFRRRRPFIDIVRAVVVGKKPGNWSFPSGHSASSFAAARMLTCVWPKKWPLFYGVAVLVGFSRVYAGAHYPSDVLSGAVAGSVLSEAIRRGVGATAARACR
jgi:undecaprenyl-diphosphatase